MYIVHCYNAPWVLIEKRYFGFAGFPTDNL